MNYDVKLRMIRAMVKVNDMFKEMPWFLGADMEIIPPTTTNIIVFINRLNGEAGQLMNTLGKLKVDQFPLKPTLKDA